MTVECSACGPDRTRGVCKYPPPPPGADVTTEIVMCHSSDGETVYACCGAEVGAGGHHPGCPYMAVNWPDGVPDA